jgi:hypothetical protein
VVTAVVGPGLLEVQRLPSFYRGQRPRLQRCSSRLAQRVLDGTILVAGRGGSPNRPRAIEVNRPYPANFWRGGRVVDGSGLENRQGASPRGFESHPLRRSQKVIDEKLLVIGLGRSAGREQPSS